VGVIEAQQKEKGQTTENDRLLAVAIHSYNHQNIKSLDDVDKKLLDQVEEFFVAYNKSRGKKFKVKGRYGPKRAAQLIDAGIKKFKKKK